MSTILILLAIIGGIALIIGIAVIFLVVKLKDTDYEKEMWTDDEGNEYI